MSHLWVIYQDNYPKYFAKSTQKQLTSHKISLIQWSFQFPDLNQGPGTRPGWKTCALCLKIHLLNLFTLSLELELYQTTRKSCVQSLKTVLGLHILCQFLEQITQINTYSQNKRLLFINQLLKCVRCLTVSGFQNIYTAFHFCM